MGRRKAPPAIYDEPAGRNRQDESGPGEKQAASCTYLLDGNNLSGSDFRDAETALRDIGRRIGCLFLDGQFTALEDLRGHDGVQLDGAARIEIVLDELRPGETMEDASV